MKAQKPISVLLADDHPVVMRAFAMALADFHLEVVAQAVSPAEAFEKYESLRPDVAVLDIRFGIEETGMEVAGRILKKYPAAKIVFLSQFDQINLIKEAYRIGGVAFITKNCDPEMLATAVTRAHEGSKYFMPEVAEKLAMLAVSGDASPQARLEAREIEIFVLMAKGLTNLEIAEQLGLSSKTISNASQTIKEKLGARRPADLTRLAVKFALIDP